MYIVYVLCSVKTGKHYVGSTPNLRQRLDSHNQGKNKATKAYVPWELIYFEAYPNKQTALDREFKLKHHGKGLYEIKKRLGLV